MKLRKMLGEIDLEECKEMMSVIETQSKETLALWGIEYVKENYVTIYKKHHQNSEKIIEEVIDVCEKTIKEKTDWKVVKPLLKDARQYSATLKDPIAQAAARAISTACAIYQTPTNALGFIYYGAAAVAYDELGIDKVQEDYDKVAKKEWQKALSSLKQHAKENETNPVKVKWNC